MKTYRSGETIWETTNGAAETGMQHAGVLRVPFFAGGQGFDGPAWNVMRGLHAKTTTETAAPCLKRPGRLAAGNRILATQGSEAFAAPNGQVGGRSRVEGGRRQCQCSASTIARRERALMANNPAVRSLIRPMIPSCTAASPERLRTVTSPPATAGSTNAAAALPSLPGAAFWSRLLDARALRPGVLRKSHAGHATAQRLEAVAAAAAAAARRSARCAQPRLSRQAALKSGPRHAA